MSPDDALALDARIRAAQVRLIYGQGRALVLGAATAAAATMLFAWWLGAGEFPWPWLAALAVVSAVRLGVIGAYHRAGAAIGEAGLWGRRFWLGTLAAGTLWSSWAVSRHDPGEIELLLLLSTVFAGMVAVSANSAGAHLPSFLSFSVPLTLPLAGAHVVSGRHSLVATGVLLGLFLVVNAALALRTSRHHAELIRARCNEEALLARLEREKRIAEQAVVAKSRFLAAASHDLRQPLHALGLFVEALRRRVAGAEERAIVEDVAGSTDALKELLDSLLDLSRLDAETVPFEPRDVSLDALFERLRARFAPEALEKGLVLEANARALAARTDPILLERVLGNLLSNAVRYTERGGVRLEARRVAGGACRIELADTGVGIPAAAREEVFGEYVQLDNPARDRAQGLGLGLAIVRRLCALMDVPLEMDSALGRGTRFRLDVPQGRPARTRPPAGARPPACAGALVLVVDDERPVLEATGRLLESRGCNALLAGSAREALRAVALAGRDPDLVLSDLRLGAGESGIEAVAAIREAVSPALPAAIVTGDTSPGRLREIRASGLEALYKPVSPAELDALLARPAPADGPAARALAA